MHGIQETLAEQEIAIAVHKQHARAGRCNLSDQVGDLPMERISQFFIADPVFEEVTQDDERAGFAGARAQEALERGGGGRHAGRQVQIRNKKHRPGNPDRCFQRGGQ